jgi:NAD(P)-dependent dehydrogenase (short-subunit alcohol dehydrogenase family)
VSTRFGRIDILICAAGVMARVPTLEMMAADWQRILDTNLTGTLRACRAFVGPMLERRDGRIITIASMRPLSVASPSPCTPASVISLSVTKFRPGLQTMIRPSMIFMSWLIS